MDTLLSMRVFCQVVNSGSFTRAAELLDISIPMASKHVSHLEKHIGAQLLHRNQRNLKLTEQGENYFRDCTTALSLLDNAAEEAMQGRCNPKGVLRINAPVWFSCETFAHLVAQYQATYPDVEVILTLSNRHVDLNSDGEDVALRLSHHLQDNLIAKKITHIPFYLVATPNYLARYSMPTKPEQLEQHLFILPTYTDLNSLKVQHNGKLITLTLGKSVARSNHTQMIANLIRADMGIGYIPAWLAGEDLVTGKLIQILPKIKIIDPPLYAVYTNRQFMKAKVRSFIDFLANHLSCN